MHFLARAFSCLLPCLFSDALALLCLRRGRDRSQSIVALTSGCALLRFEKDIRRIIGQCAKDRQTL
eukprot:3295593-Rhodomonas_salina.1